jgi:CheY-like chemotaxis protein
MKNAHILLVEDNEGDIILTLEALEDRKFVRQLSIVKNGKDAIDFVLKRSRFDAVEKPDLILLDINLPKKNGHEVLQIIKSNQQTKTIPVIMFTTSSSQHDIMAAYRKHANCYITKPVELDEFMATMWTIEEFWLNWVQLPGLSPEIQNSNRPL